MTSTGSILTTPSSVRKMPTQSNHVNLGHNDLFGEDRDFTSHRKASIPFLRPRYSSTPFHYGLNSQSVGSSWTTPIPSLNPIRKDLSTPIKEPTISGYCTPSPNPGFPKDYAGLLDTRLLRNTLGSCKAVKLGDDPASPVQFRFSPFKMPKVRFDNDQGSSSPTRSSADKGVQTSPFARRNGEIPNGMGLQKVRLKRKRSSGISKME